MYARIFPFLALAWIVEPMPVSRHVGCSDVHSFGQHQIASCCVVSFPDLVDAEVLLIQAAVAAR